MKPFLSIPNWDEMQHYKDRTPPWIKLHNELLEDYDFECLPDASKAHLLCIWLLASRTGNNINPDPRWIGRKIGANSDVDIDLLVKSGFLLLNQPLQDVEQDASKVIQTVEQDAIPEREERESRGEGEREHINTSVAIAPVRQKRFKPPTNDDVFTYMFSRGISSPPAREESEKFCDFYASKDWMVGKRNRINFD